MCVCVRACVRAYVCVCVCVCVCVRKPGVHYTDVVKQNTIKAVRFLLIVAALRTADVCLKRITSCVHPQP